MPEPSYIPPEGILRIREARGETQREFAQHLEVTHGTVSAWERGELTLSAEHTDTIRELIPADVSLDEVIEPVTDVDEWGEFIPPAERRLFTSKWLRKLREQPLTTDQLPDSGKNSFSEAQRMFVQRLGTGASRGDTDRLGGQLRVVYYLEGDERRAIRRFIEENEALLSEALQKNRNRFQSEWSEFLYGLLEEEWRFWICGQSEDESV